MGFFSNEAEELDFGARLAMPASAMMGRTGSTCRRQHMEQMHVSTNCPISWILLCLPTLEIAVQPQPSLYFKWLVNNTTI